MTNDDLTISMDEWKSLTVDIRDVLREKAALESQLTAARRSVAELRAWVEAKRKSHRPDRFKDSWDDACEHAYSLVLGELARLTDPSPAAPADDAKTEAQQRVEGAMDSADARFAQAEADDAKPEAGRSSDGNR